MKLLNLSEWSDVAEIVSSIAIVVSLLYVGYQVKQNTYGLQQSSFQKINDQLIIGDMALVQDGELHKIIKTAENSPTDVSAENWSRYTHFMYPRIGAWEYLYISKQEKASNDAHWSAFEPYFLNTICKPGVLRFWQENKNGFAPMFRQYINSTIDTECVAE